MDVPSGRGSRAPTTTSSVDPDAAVSLEMAAALLMSVA
jgi:hypothetical protein